MFIVIVNPYLPSHSICTASNMFFVFEYFKIYFSSAILTISSIIWYLLRPLSEFLMFFPPCMEARSTGSVYKDFKWFWVIWSEAFLSRFRVIWDLILWREGYFFLALLEEERFNFVLILLWPATFGLDCEGYWKFLI